VAISKSIAIDAMFVPRPDHTTGRAVDLGGERNRPRRRKSQTAATEHPWDTARDTD
jgi:hypothetical protein